MKPNVFVFIGLLFTMALFTSAWSGVVKDLPYDTLSVGVKPTPQPTHMPPGMHIVPRTQGQNTAFRIGTAQHFEGKEQPAQKVDNFEENRTQLEQRISVVQQGLTRCGIRSVSLGTEETVELFYKLFNPGGVYVDRSVEPNRVYVFDAGNNRILGFSHLGIAKGGIHDGQPCTSDSDYA